DGIRDFHVTGVQTCALPISTGDYLAPTLDRILWFAKHKEALKFRPYLLKKKPGEKGGTGYKNIRTWDGQIEPLTKEQATGEQDRSEERRVGKEWRSQWPPDA